MLLSTRWLSFWHHKLWPLLSATLPLTWHEWRDSHQSTVECIRHTVMQTRKCFTASGRLWFHLHSSDICNHTNDKIARSRVWNEAGYRHSQSGDWRQSPATTMEMLPKCLLGGGATSVINVPSCGDEAPAHCHHRINNDRHPAQSRCCHTPDASTLITLH